ncbi:geranylgeranyl reductase family protein [Thermomonospora cellulosilytica]|uniref:Geranylgeranyl reductase family protein n=1 Tax=Thermomonospora cellulosilytica TaxID=1411118 RepID=A0A7W3MT55_9ACTN|nr:geranylgeranyl reductase family protein [Thermomonospora cellulosilytica]MBA9001417.1 geranylgeranyl reductase family protein [Thermomonospora cellulosilytica]
MTDSSGQADVIVVGAGPAGSATAYWLAQAGLDVLLLEKATFPRDKVCGDGLTPRAVRALISMGVDLAAPGWTRTRGLRIYGGGVKIELDWPELATFPDFGMVRARTDLDQLLAEHAAKAGAGLRQGCTVTGPIVDERTGRIVGVTARHEGEEVEYRAPLVVAADGVSSRLSLAMGIRKREDRPMGVAVRRYYRTPRHDDEYLESWLELWDGQRLLPGYGWVFPLGNGLANVGLGLLNTSKAFQNVDYRAMMRGWCAQMPEEWQFDEEHAEGPIRGAALPMGFNRQPHYSRGMLLVGDAGGMVNPFNGEGIDYGLESGRLAAETIVQALARPTAGQRERTLHEYPRVLKEEHGGYFTLGRLFVRAIGDPRVMKFLTRHGLPHPTLMRFTLKLLANLTDPRGGDAMDRIINAMSKVAPAA